MFQIDLKKFLCLKILKILCREDMLLVILTEKKLLERFRKKNQKEFNAKKVTKKKDNKLYVKWKDYDRS